MKVEEDRGEGFGRRSGRGVKISEGRMCIRPGRHSGPSVAGKFVQMAGRENQRVAFVMLVADRRVLKTTRKTILTKSNYISSVL